MSLVTSSSNNTSLLLAVPITIGTLSAAYYYFKKYYTSLDSQQAQKGQILLWQDENYQGPEQTIQIPGRYTNTSGQVIQSQKVGDSTLLKYQQGSNWIQVLTPGVYSGEWGIPQNAICQALQSGMLFSIDIKFSHNIEGQSADAFTSTWTGMFKQTQINSGDPYTGLQLPILYPSNEVVGAHFVIAQRSPYNVVAEGDIYFVHNIDTEDITGTPASDFPANVSFHKDDIWGFSVVLNNF